MFGSDAPAPAPVAVAVAFITAWLEAGIEPPPEDDRARDQLAAAYVTHRINRKADDALQLVDELKLCPEAPSQRRAELGLSAPLRIRTR